MSTAGTTITVTATATSSELSFDPDETDNTADDSFTVNRPPEATDDVASTPEDTLINVGSANRPSFLWLAVFGVFVIRRWRRNQ